MTRPATRGTSSGPRPVRSLAWPGPGSRRWPGLGLAWPAGPWRGDGGTGSTAGERRGVRRVSRQARGRFPAGAAGVRAPWEQRRPRPWLGPDPGFDSGLGLAQTPASASAPGPGLALASASVSALAPASVRPRSRSRPAGSAVPRRAVGRAADVGPAERCAAQHEVSCGSTAPRKAPSRWVPHEGAADGRRRYAARPAERSWGPVPGSPPCAPGGPRVSRRRCAGFPCRSAWARWQGRAGPPGLVHTEAYGGPRRARRSCPGRRSRRAAHPVDPVPVDGDRVAVVQPG